MRHEPLSELHPSQAGNWLLMLELDRLAWRSRAFDRAIDAAKANDDIAFRRAMKAFPEVASRDGGCANNAPPTDQ